MWLRAGSVVVWALVAGSAVFWGLRLFTAAPGMPAGTQPATSVASAQADLTRLLGADPVAAEPVAAAADARFHLLGVVSPRAGAPAEARQGLALIAVDGKPARAFHVGAAVTDSAQLQSVSPRGATLGPRDGRGGTVALSLPPLAPAATGPLPAAAGSPGAGIGPAPATPGLAYRPALSPPLPRPFGTTGTTGAPVMTDMSGTAPSGDAAR